MGVLTTIPPPVPISGLSCRLTLQVRAAFPSCFRCCRAIKNVQRWDSWIISFLKFYQVLVFLVFFILSHFWILFSIWLSIYTNLAYSDLIHLIMLEIVYYLLAFVLLWAYLLHCCIMNFTQQTLYLILSFFLSFLPSLLQQWIRHKKSTWDAKSGPIINDKTLPQKCQ